MNLLVRATRMYSLRPVSDHAYATTDDVTAPVKSIITHIFKSLVECKETSTELVGDHNITTELNLRYTLLTLF